METCNEIPRMFSCNLKLPVPGLLLQGFCYRNPIKFISDKLERRKITSASITTHLFFIFFSTCLQLESAHLKRYSHYNRNGTNINKSIKHMTPLSNLFLLSFLRPLSEEF